MLLQQQLRWAMMGAAEHTHCLRLMLFLTKQCLGPQPVAPKQAYRRSCVLFTVIVIAVTHSAV